MVDIIAFNNWHASKTFVNIQEVVAIESMGIDYRRFGEHVCNLTLRGGNTIQILGEVNDIVYLVWRTSIEEATMQTDIITWLNEHNIDIDRGRQDKDGHENIRIRWINSESGAEGFVTGETFIEAVKEAMTEDKTMDHDFVRNDT